MNLHDEYRLAMTRRQFFGRTSSGIGLAALASILNQGPLAAQTDFGKINPKTGGLRNLPHFAPKAKRVIFLHQSGAPSQIDLFDHKPMLKDLVGTELPASIRMGQRITGMTSGQDSLPVAPSMFEFHKHGKSGTLISDLIPHHGKIVDDIAIIKDHTYRCY